MLTGELFKDLIKEMVEKLKNEEEEEKKEENREDFVVRLANEITDFMDEFERDGEDE